MAARLIKKYPNRRLYDTVGSRYVTLADLRQRVCEGDELQVLDAKTGRDITRNILLMIVADRRGPVEQLLNADFLKELIRSGIHGNRARPGDEAASPPGPGGS